MGGLIGRLMARFVARLEGESGQTMVEYGLLVVFIALVALVGVQLLGTDLLGFFTSFANKL